MTLDSKDAKSFDTFENGVKINTKATETAANGADFKCEASDTQKEEQSQDFQPPDGGVWAWIVCATSFWANGTLFGILNIFGIVYVALKKQYEDSGDDSLSFKLGTLLTDIFK